MGFFDNEPAETETPMIQACWLTYDIPDSADIVNPSNELRPIAFRANLSCWVIQECDIPYMLLNDLRQAGADVHVVRFDASEAPKLLRMAGKAIEKDIRAAVASAKANATTAALKMNEADNPQEALRQYKNAQTRITKALGQKLKDLKSVAQRFHVAAQVPSLPTSVTAVASLRLTMMERAKAYSEAVAELEAKLGPENAVVTTAKKSGIPGEILADYLDDNGLNGGKLRSRFFD
jgi:hypothetical protein